MLCELLVSLGGQRSPRAVEVAQRFLLFRFGTGYRGKLLQCCIES